MDKPGYMYACGQHRRSHVICIVTPRAVLWSSGLDVPRLFTCNQADLHVTKLESAVQLSMYASCSTRCHTRPAPLSDVIPKVWVAPVNGIIPGIGYHVR